MNIRAVIAGAAAAAALALAVVAAPPANAVTARHTATVGNDPLLLVEGILNEVTMNLAL